MHYSWSIINYCQLLSVFSTCQSADATRAPGEMNLKRQMLQDLGLRGWIALYQGPWGRWLADVFLLDSKIVMSHESQFLWVGLPNRSPSTWTQIIKDKFRWFLSNFGDSERGFSWPWGVWGKVQVTISNVTFWTIKRGSKGQTYTNELREHGFARVGQITGRFSQDHGSIFTQVRWFAIHGSCCGVVDCFLFLCSHCGSVYTTSYTPLYSSPI